MNNRNSLIIFAGLIIAVFASCERETCSDGILNNNEIKVDCGGPNCDICPNCYDGILNNGEEQVDCGGENCEPCQFSWSKVETSFSVNFHDVDFLNESHGFIVGDNGTILESNDGGETWSKISSPYAGAIYSIHFKDENLIAIAGGEGSVYISKNGGSSWTKSETQSSSNIFGVHIISEEEMLFCGAEQQLALSDDGGETWDYKDLQPKATVAYNGFGFLDSKVGYAVGDGFYRKTIDGGDSWPVQINQDGDIYDIELLSSKRWFAATTVGLLLSNDSDIVNKSIPIYKGGLSSYGETLYFAGQDEGQTNGVIYRSVDNGVLWKLEERLAGVVFNEVIALNEKEAIAIGNNGNIYRRGL